MILNIMFISSLNFDSADNFLFSSHNIDVSPLIISHASSLYPLKAFLNYEFIILNQSTPFHCYLYLEKQVFLVLRLSLFVC